MSSKIIAGNATNLGIVNSGASDGILEFQSGSTPTTAVTIDTSQTITSTSHIVVANGSNLGWGSNNIGFSGNSSTGVLSTYTAGSERMRIGSTGNVLIGTTSGSGNRLDVVGGGASITASGTSFNLLNIKDSVDQSGATFVQFYNSTGGGIGNINRVGTTNAVVYNTTSDQRLKSNVEDANPILDKLMNVKVRQFDWTIGDLHQDAGFIAQELEPILTGIVSKGKSEEDMWQLDYSRLTPYLVKAIQELNAKVEEQATTITTLQAKVGA